MILLMNWMKTLKVRWRGSYQLTVAQRRCSEIYIFSLFLLQRLKFLLNPINVSITQYCLILLTIILLIPLQLYGDVI